MVQNIFILFFLDHNLRKNPKSKNSFRTCESQFEKYCPNVFQVVIDFFFKIQDNRRHWAIFCDCCNKILWPLIHIFNTHLGLESAVLLWRWAVRTLFCRWTKSGNEQHCKATETIVVKFRLEVRVVSNWEEKWRVITQIAQPWQALTVT